MPVCLPNLKKSLKLWNDGESIILACQLLLLKHREPVTMCHQSIHTRKWVDLLNYHCDSSFINKYYPLCYKVYHKGSFQSNSCMFNSRHAHMWTWTYRLDLTSQCSVGVCDEIRWERTYSPAPWLIFTVKDNRQCPTAHNANFWHISVNFMPDLWWHAVTSVTVHHSSRWVIVAWKVVTTHLILAIESSVCKGTVLLTQIDKCTS